MASIPNAGEALTSGNAEDDLKYVRAVIQRRRSLAGAPAGIYIVWGLISVVGFALVDFSPRHAGIFWSIAGPVGGLLSWLIGRQADKSSEIEDAELNRRIALHWLGLFAAWALIYLLPVSGKFDGRQVGEIILLVVLIFYYLGAVHLDKRLTVPTVILTLGFIALMFLPRYAWTATGVFFLAAMLFSAYQARQVDAAQR